MIRLNVYTAYRCTYIPILLKSFNMMFFKIVFEGIAGA